MAEPRRGYASASETPSSILGVAAGGSSAKKFVAAVRDQKLVALASRFSGLGYTKIFHKVAALLGEQISPAFEIGGWMLAAGSTGPLCSLVDFATTCTRLISGNCYKAQHGIFSVSRVLSICIDQYRKCKSEYSLVPTTLGRGRLGVRRPLPGWEPIPSSGVAVLCRRAGPPGRGCR